MPSNNPIHNGVATPPQRREVVVVLVGKYGANANTCACSDMLNAITIIIKIVKIILFPMDTKRSNWLRLYFQSIPAGIDDEKYDNIHFLVQYSDYDTTHFA